MDKAPALSITLGFCILGVNSAIYPQSLEIVPREVWGARPPTLIEPMTNPVPYVVIHHSYIPAACYTNEDCVRAVKGIQDYHQLNHSWNDIGYSFLAGGDNRIYTGRGWSAIGAHAPGYNNRSIGICVIGDWRVELPPESQLVAVKQLIQKGVTDGHIREDYRLIGHRQVRATECPGDALFREIQTWPHWVEDPNAEVNIIPHTSKEDLKPDPREGGDLPDEPVKTKRHALDYYASA